VAQRATGTAPGLPCASTRRRPRWEKVWRPRVSMTAAAASGSVMPSAASECTIPSDTAARTSGWDPAALAPVIWDWSWSSPTGTSLTLMLVCCSNRLMIAWVALTRSGLSSALQNVRVGPPACLALPPQPTTVARITASRAMTKLRARIAPPPCLAPARRITGNPARELIVASPKATDPPRIGEPWGCDRGHSGQAPKGLPGLRSKLAMLGITIVDGGSGTWPWSGSDAAPCGWSGRAQPPRGEGVGRRGRGGRRPGARGGGGGGGREGRRPGGRGGVEGAGGARLGSRQWALARRLRAGVAAVGRADRRPRQRHRHQPALPGRPALDAVPSHPGRRGPGGARGRAHLWRRQPLSGGECHRAA